MAALKGHGTPAGYKAGCKSRGGCPSRSLIACVDADIRYRSDVAFQRGIDAGLPLEVILEADAPAVADRPKPKARPRPAQPLVPGDALVGVPLAELRGQLELSDARLDRELASAPVSPPAMHSLICEATITRGRGRARCDYPDGHAGAHVGQFGNGTTIDWPNRPGLDDNPEVLAALDPVPFSEEFPPDGGPLASTLEHARPDPGLAPTERAALVHQLLADANAPTDRHAELDALQATARAELEERQRAELEQLGLVDDFSEEALELQPLVLDLGDPFNGRHLLGCPGDDGCTCPPVTGLLEALVSAERRPGNLVLITHELRASLAGTLDQLTRLVLLRENAYAQLLAQNTRLLKAAR